MMKRLRFLFFGFLGLSFGFLLLALFKNDALAETKEPTAIVYFTGVGCPHCAKVDLALLAGWTRKYPNLIVFEYEIYQQRQNAGLLENYNQEYQSGLGIPLAIFDKSSSIRGDRPILDSFENELEKQEGNRFLLRDGSQIAFENLNINLLPGYPKIWMNDRIAVKTKPTIHSPEGVSQLVKEFLISEDPRQVFEGQPYQLKEPEAIALSGSQQEFGNAAQLDSWLLEWNGFPLEKGAVEQPRDIAQQESPELEMERQEISWPKTISLAFVDAVNPCALAVMTMMLLAIITYNPQDKKNIILVGLAFTLAVFLMYLFYGLVIIRFFKIVQLITNVRLILYKILAIVAIILGSLQIKDFLRYKPGSLGTEMPLGLRPKVKKIISGITSPLGAFGVGLFVTVFLLPCTIGPYIILGGMLSFSESLKTLPYLLLYNFIFILPMLLITALVYLGISKIDDVSAWKDKNVKILHLIAGLIIICLGVAMLFGWV